MKSAVQTTIGILLGATMLGSPAVAASMKQIATIAVPGAALDSFDISFIDQANNRYYLGDRSNKAVDIVDTATNTFVGRVEGFAGFVKSNDNAGPNGVLVVPDTNEAWAGDGDSTVKVIDLKTNKIVDTISTGGKNRADEVAYDDKDHVFFVTNDADEPPFATLISTQPGHKIVAKVPFPQATGGIEQAIYYRPTGMFIMSIPQLNGDKAKGGLAVVDPRDGKLVKTLEVNGCIPAGLAQGPGANLIIGCNAGGKNTNLPPVSVVVNADTGAVVARVDQVGAADEVAYNAKTGQYYIAARQMPGGAVLGVIDANTNSWVENLKTGGNAHSVATSASNGHVFVPLPATGGPCGGCIGVFANQ